MSTSAERERARDRAADGIALTEEVKCRAWLAGGRQTRAKEIEIEKARRQRGMKD